MADIKEGGFQNSTPVLYPGQASPLTPTHKLKGLLSTPWLAWKAKDPESWRIASVTMTTEKTTARE